MYLTSKRRRKDHAVAHQFFSSHPAGLSNDIDNDIRSDHTAVARERAGDLGVRDTDLRCGRGCTLESERHRKGHKN
jgi:hypothetical protein